MLVQAVVLQALWAYKVESLGNCHTYLLYTCYIVLSHFHSLFTDTSNLVCIPALPQNLKRALNLQKRLHATV